MGHMNALQHSETARGLLREAGALLAVCSGSSEKQRALRSVLAIDILAVVDRAQRLGADPGEVARIRRAVRN
jgi:hypothetical protein